MCLWVNTSSSGRVRHVSSVIGGDTLALSPVRQVVHTAPLVISSDRQVIPTLRQPTPAPVQASSPMQHAISPRRRIVSANLLCCLGAPDGRLVRSTGSLFPPAARLAASTPEALLLGPVVSTSRSVASPGTPGRLLPRSGRLSASSARGFAAYRRVEEAEGSSRAAGNPYAVVVGSAHTRFGSRRGVVGTTTATGSMHRRVCIVPCTGVPAGSKL